jgi:hypothetical protein
MAEAGGAITAAGVAQEGPAADAEVQCAAASRVRIALGCQTE